MAETGREQVVQVVCRYCSAVIVADPEVRTPRSAWSAPDAEEPTACVTSAPGHAPAGRVEWVMRPSQALE